MIMGSDNVISNQTGKNKLLSPTKPEKQLLSINNHAPLIWLVEEKYE